VIQLHDLKRTDREALTKTWTSPYGISLATFPAIMNSENGAKGCFDSHVAIASLNPSYFVLEDDAVPTPEASTEVELFTELNNAIKAQTYDLIWLGGLPMPDTTFKRFKTSGLLEGKCLTTYAMYVGPRAKQFIQQQKYSGNPIDVVLAESNLRTAFAHPPLFRQACTPSDIGKSEFTRGKLFASLLHGVGPIWRWSIIYQNYLLLFLLYLCIRYLLKSE